MPKSEAQNTAPAAEKPAKKREYHRRIVNGTTAPDSKFQPLSPTCGQDLMGAWQLPARAWTGARLKVCRKIYGSNQLELIRETTLEDYSMDAIARENGAGEYDLIWPSDPNKEWGPHSCRINVSSEYATAAGWSAMPVIKPAPPRVADVRVYDDMSQALARPGSDFTPAALASMMETIARNTAEQMRQYTPPPPPPQDPMARFQEMFSLFDMLEKRQDTKMEKMLAFLGQKTPAAESAAEPVSWQQMLIPAVVEALPTIAEAAKAIFSPRQVVPTGGYYPPPVGAPPPQSPAIHQNQAPAVPAAPVEDPVMAPAPEQIKVPMSQEEIDHFAPAVAMLRPFAGIVVNTVNGSENASAAAAQIADYIPYKLEPLMIELAAMAKERGAEVLGIIDPKLCTEKGLACAVAIGDILSQPEE